MRLSDQIAQRLQHLIAEQGLKPGDRLPAERQLASDLGVSRASIREAIQKLGSLGVVQSRRGGGTFVQSPLAANWQDNSIVRPLAALVQQDPEYRYDVLEARHALEGSTAWHAALRATPEEQAEIRRRFDDMVRFQGQGDADLLARADAQFHLAIAEASHNLVLLQVMRGLFDLLQATVTQNRQAMYLVPNTADQLIIQHREVMEAIMRGDAEAARTAVGHHLQFVHNCVRTLDEDEARRARLTRLPTFDSKP